MCLTIFSWLISFSSSSFVCFFCLHSPFVFCVGSKILLNNLLSNTNNFCLMFSVNTQHSDPYTATGLITVRYSLSLVFLIISLLWNNILNILGVKFPMKMRKKKDIWQNLAKEILGIINTAFKPTMVQTFSRINVCKALAVPILIWKRKLKP